MSRSCYVDDLDYWAYVRWRGAVTSALRGRRGQDFLREMAASMDAMPERRLVADVIVSPEGECCAMGAVALRRGLDVSDLDPDEGDRVAAAFGIAEAMAREIAFVNDELFMRDAPEERWANVRAWIDMRLIERPAEGRGS